MKRKKRRSPTRRREAEARRTKQQSTVLALLSGPFTFLGMTEDQLNREVERLRELQDHNAPKHTHLPPSAA